MKKSATKTMLLVMITIVSVLMVAQIAKAASIASTKHDLSAKGWGSTQLCIFCHTPHNAYPAGTAPLWNHATTATSAFTLYSSTISSTLNATTGQPTGVSKACLSCHDGTVAVDAYQTRGTSTSGFIAAGSSLGTDLSNDHPISFTYDAALATADGGLVTPLSSSWVVAAAGAISGIPLFAGKMECASCHNVHDNANAPFLRIANTGSALCLKCHNK
jgi:predicted CXXCH cytochrome family protein